MTLVFFVLFRSFETQIKQYTLYVFNIALLFTFLYQEQAHSEYIEQINIQQGVNIDSVYIKLLAKDAPLTVENFRNYVSDGDYTNSFIHRSVPGFVVQGGGFTFDPTLNDGSFTYDATNDIYTGGLQEMAEDVPVINEFGNSNLRGTLAMAKLGTGPDTATSQWFVNLADNLFLDTQNGGFTVFAEVLKNGMDVVDVVASQTIVDRSDIHFAFGSIPLLSFSSDPVIEDNLVRINSITEVLSISPDISYGTVTPTTNLQPEIVIQNTGGSSVSIGNIGVQNPLSKPFSIVSDLCSKKTLVPGQRCTFITLFSPESSGVFEDSFDIELPGLGINYLIKLSGEGGPVVVEPDLVEADISSTFSSINFGEQDVFFNPDVSPYIISSTINNFGGIPLEFSTISLSSDSDAEFSLSDATFLSSDNCIKINTLAQDETCKIKVLYLPLVDGSHRAKLVIESNDPDESPFVIPIFAAALQESDGIDKAVEDAAPNLGDGNNDDILDSQQSNVASLPDLKGTYITYVSEPNQPFEDVRIVNLSAADENPDNVILGAGVHEFTLNNVAFGAIVDVGLLLPANVDASEYYVYGPTRESSTPLWYKFDVVGETGASFIGIAKFTSPTDSTIDRSVVFLRIKNGGRGDSSNEQDNKIIVKSGINYNNSNSVGLLSFFFLQAIVLTLLFFRASQLFCRQRPRAGQR